MSIKITINKAQILAKVQAAEKEMIPTVGNQILADCQEFVPQDQNVLRATAAINTSLSGKYETDEELPPEKQAILAQAEGSDLKKGRIVWDTPYAQKRYHVGSPSHNKNPRASLMWCEAARSEYGKEWQKIAQKSFDQALEK